MIKIIYTQNTPIGLSFGSEMRVETSEKVNVAEIRAIFQAISGKPFQENVKEQLRAICGEQGISSLEISGL